MNLSFYEYFYDAFYDDCKYSVITARRREGKTQHSVIWLGTKLASEPNIKALWVDTTQNNLNKYYTRYWYPTFKELFDTNLWQYNQSTHVLICSNGSVLDFSSAERPENMEGFAYDYVVLNEAGIILRKSGLWDNTIAPMTKNSKKVIIIGTPKAGSTKFYELSQNCYKSDSWKTYRITPANSIEWSKEELDEVKKQVPDVVWRQEYCGEFVGDGSGVFRIDNITNQLSTKPTKVLGIDIGRYEDETVIIGLDQDCSITYIDSFTDVDFDVQKTRIVNIWRDLNFPKINIDMTGLGLSIFDSLKNQIGTSINGINMNYNTKIDMIQNAQLLIENGTCKLIDHDKLIDQLRSYEYEKTKGGRITYNAPDGMHDDYVIGLSLALLEYSPAKKTVLKYNMLIPQ